MGGKYFKSEAKRIFGSDQVDVCFLAEVYPPNYSIRKAKIIFPNI